MPKPKSILQSAKGGPYEKQAIRYTLEKIQANSVEIMEKWDNDHNIPKTITRQVIQKDGKVKNIRVDNPESMLNKVLGLDELMNKHRDEDFDSDEAEKYFGRRYFQGATPAQEEVWADPDEAEKEFTETVLPMRNIMESYINSDDDDVKQFREIFEINMLPMEFERGDFTRAMMDNVYLTDLYSETGSGPQIARYSCKELRKHLDGPIDPVTGKPTKPLKLINRYYKSINELFDMEYAKQKLMDNGYTEEQERRYLEELKAKQQQMIDAFEELRVFESEHKGEYPNTYLNNDLYHFVDYERAPIAAFGHLKGQVRAIDNGWGMDDLTVLGILGELDYRAAFSIKRKEKELLTEKKTLKKNEDTLKEKEEELKQLRTGNDKDKIKAAEKELENLQNQIKENKSKIDKIERNLKSNKLLRKEILENEKLGWNKKIEKPSDKIEIFQEIKKLAIRPEFKDSLVTTVFNALKEELRHVEKVIKDEFMAKESAQVWSKKGMPTESRATSNILSKVVDIYGPKPKYNNELALNNDITSEQFNSTFIPYDTKDMPFSDMELAFIGMGAASLYSDKKKEILDKMKPDVHGFNQKHIDKNKSSWTTDLFSEQLGQKQKLKNQAPIIKEGRLEAEKIAKEYAAGNKKRLAVIIHNSFRQFLEEERNAGELTMEKTIHNYYMNKIFSDMLSKDKELQSEFDAINKAVRSEDKVKLSEIKNITKLYKIRLDSFDAANDIKDAEKPEAQTEKKLVHDYIRGTIVNGVCQNNKKLMIESPGSNDNKSKDNSGKPEIFNYLSTEKGSEALEKFTDDLVSKKNLNLATLKKFEKSNDELSKEKDVVEKEILKFTYESGAEKSYAELESSEEMDEKRMRELTKEIIKNKVMANRVSDSFIQGELDTLVSLSENTMKEFKGKQKVFNDILDNFVGNMDLKNITPKELAELLRAGERTTIKDITNTFASVSEFAIEKNNPNIPDLAKTADNLRKGNTGWFGDRDYKEIINDVVKLDKDVKSFANQLFENYSDKGFDELKVKYNNLLKKMNDFQKENSQYSDYVERCELMEAAINNMKNTMGYLNKYRDDLEDVKEYHEYSKNAKKMAETSSEKQIEPIEYLAKRIHEEEKNRAVNSKKYNSSDANVQKEAEKALVKSCFNALYMQVVKDEYAPKPDESPDQKEKRNETLLKAIDLGERGMVADMKKIMESEFGKQFIMNSMKMMIAGNKYDQEKILECRDMAINQCYDEFVEKFRSARNRNDMDEQKQFCDKLINLSKMSKALGSGALSGKKLPKVREDSVVHEFNLKIEKKVEPEHKNLIK